MLQKRHGRILIYLVLCSLPVDGGGDRIRLGFHRLGRGLLCALGATRGIDLFGINKLHTGKRSGFLHRKRFHILRALHGRFMNGSRYRAVVHVDIKRPLRRLQLFGRCRRGCGGRVNGLLPLCRLRCALAPSLLVGRNRKRILIRLVFHLFRIILRFAFLLQPVNGFQDRPVKAPQKRIEKRKDQQRNGGILAERGLQQQAKTSGDHASGRARLTAAIQLADDRREIALCDRDLAEDQMRRSTEQDRQKHSADPPKQSRLPVLRDQDPREDPECKRKDPIAVTDDAHQEPAEITDQQTVFAVGIQEKADQRKNSDQQQDPGVDPFRRKRFMLLRGRRGLCASGSHRRAFRCGLFGGSGFGFLLGRTCVRHEKTPFLRKLIRVQIRTEASARS